MLRSGRRGTRRARIDSSGEDGVLRERRDGAAGSVGRSHFSVSPSELAELRHQATELHATVSMLVEQATQAGLSAPAESVGTIDQRPVDRSADLGQARRAAELIISAAERRSEEIIAEAHRTRDRIVEEARAAELAAARRVEALVALLHRSGEAARSLESELEAAAGELDGAADVRAAATEPFAGRPDARPASRLFTSKAVTF